jgi:hypothetical protein
MSGALARRVARRHAFGFLQVSKQPEAAVAVLHNGVLPFYAKLWSCRCSPS